MRKAKTLAACLCVLFILTLTASSARADVFHAADMVVKLNNSDGHHLNLREEIRAGMPALFAEFFEGNNGLHLGLLKHSGQDLGLLKNSGQDLGFENNNAKHVGFSVASVNRGNKFGLFKSPQSSGGGVVGGDTTPNPEPAAVFLLGTGLAAVGAYARRRFRKSSH